MNLYFCFGLCFLPYVLCFVFFKAFSSIKISTELIASVLGLIAVFPIAFLQFITNDFLPLQDFFLTHGIVSVLLKMILCYGLIEECLKLVFMLFIPKKALSFNNFFMATLLCGLCLGCFESVLYFLHHLETATQQGAELVYYLIFARIFSANLIHTFCAGLSGIFIWSCISKQIDVLSPIFAILLHGLFDYFTSLESNLKWFSVVVILFLIIEVHIRYEKNKPLEAYKKDASPAKNHKDATIETPLKDVPTN